MAHKIEPWKDCIDWLRRCKVLSPSLPCYSLEVLTQALRDGVLLCKLLDTLDPNCLDFNNVHKKPQMTRCLCLQNIKLFLCTCQDVFGLKDSDLFEPSMLFDFHDIYQVIYTLSKLSNSVKSQKNVPGFFFQKSQVLSQTEICKKLKIEEGNYSQELRERFSYDEYNSSVRNEEIYQNLCAFKRLQSPQTSTRFAQHSGKRNYILEELLESEIKYVMVLKAVLECFMKPLKKEMSPEDIQGIFGEMQELYDIHKNFLNELDEAVSPTSTRHLSEVFLGFYNKFLIYGNYCANMNDAQALLKQKCLESPFLCEEIMRCQESVKDGRFALEDLLCMPFQRILKYPLLLERLIGDTQPSHEDYRGLEEANDAMKDIATYVNELKRAKEKLEALQNIEDNIIDLKMPSNTTLKNYGNCLKDDELRVKSPYGEKNNNRYVFLFDHVMLICKQLKDNKYSFQESLNLSEYKLKDCPLIARRPMSSWFLIPENRNDAYMFSAKQEKKKEWIKTIEETLDNIKPNCLSSTDHQLFLKTFKPCTTCSHCKKSLKGLVFQGYWCKMCQFALHKGCIIPSGRCIAQVKRATAAASANRRPIPPPPYSEVINWSDYRYLGQYNWFVGEIEKEEASNWLKNCINGTYLLRVRPQGRKNPNESSYALGLKTSAGIKHIIVYETTNNGLLQYYLSPIRYFKTIAELIQFYEHCSLKENFEKLDTKLLLPYHQVSPVGHATNIYQGESNASSGAHQTEDYVEYDSLGDGMKLESGTINQEDLHVNNLSLYNVQEELNTDCTSSKSDLNCTIVHTSSYQMTETIYERSSEEHNVAGGQQWSTPANKKDKRLLRPSQSFPKTSTEKNRMPNLHVKSKRTVTASNPSFRKTYTDDFLGKEERKLLSKQEFDDKSSFDSSMNGRLQLRQNSIHKRYLRKSSSDSTTRKQICEEDEAGEGEDGEDEETEEEEISTHRPLDHTPRKYIHEADEIGEGVDEEFEEGQEEEISLHKSLNYNSREQINELDEAGAGEDGEIEVQEEEELEGKEYEEYLDVNFYESKSLGNSSEHGDSTCKLVPKQKTSSRSITIGTQTSNLDIPFSYDHIEIFGQFIVSELKTIQNKTILQELKKAIQNVVTKGIEKDNTR